MKRAFLLRALALFLAGATPLLAFVVPPRPTKAPQPALPLVVRPAAVQGLNFGDLLGSLFGGVTEEAASVEKTDVVVVGSGISGSTMAFYLDKAGTNCLLTESNAVVGGNVISK